jgi:hypothetical protein
VSGQVYTTADLPSKKSPSVNSFQILFPFTGKQIMYKCKLSHFRCIYEGVSKSVWTGLLERELQMVQLSATRCSCIAILWDSLVSFAAITLCVSSQRVCIIIVVVYFVIDSVRKLLDTPSYASVFSVTYKQTTNSVAVMKSTSTRRVYDTRFSEVSSVFVTCNVY